MKFALGFFVGAIIGRRTLRSLGRAIDGMIYSKRY